MYSTGGSPLPPHRRKEREMKKGSMAMVLAALLVATIVGAVWARPNEATEAVTRKVTIPAASFIPNQDGLSYGNTGQRLWVNSGSAEFIAPVVFPCVEWVTVRKVTLSVTDNNANDDACVFMFRASPKNLSAVMMAQACSSSSGGAHNYSDATIDNAQVYRNQSAFLILDMWGPSIDVYGVTIEYKRHI
jgi:hypothetical protein